MSGSVAPSTVEYLPSSQGTQLADPEPDCHEPAQHVVHDVLDSFEYVPGRQRAQADAPLVLLQEPAGQREQDVASVEE